MHNLFYLYTVISGEGIFKYADHGGSESEDHEQDRYHAKCGDCDFGRLTYGGPIIKLTRFVNVCNCCADKENCDVEPVR